MSTKSETHRESMGDGHSVTIQHCEYQYADGEVCNEYLGVNYPSEVCDKHRSDFNPHDNVTSDGTLIRLGLVVMDYDRKIGTVVSDNTSPYMHQEGYCGGDHWFTVERFDGSRATMNGPRLMARGGQ